MRPALRLRRHVHGPGAPLRWAPAAMRTRHDQGGGQPGAPLLWLLQVACRVVRLLPLGPGSRRAQRRLLRQGEAGAARWHGRHGRRGDRSERRRAGCGSTRHWRRARWARRRRRQRWQPRRRRQQRRSRCRPRRLRCRRWYRWRRRYRGRRRQEEADAQGQAEAVQPGRGLPVQARAAARERVLPQRRGGGARSAAGVPGRPRTPE